MKKLVPWGICLIAALVYLAAWWGQIPNEHKPFPTKNGDPAYLEEFGR